ncbi:MAG: DUF5060 domain-containing protein, partial [Bacteroidia bacterium]
SHDTIRHHCLWGTLLAGGTGVEWYFGYRFKHNDLMLEDFRSRELWWKQSTLATQFMNGFPLEDMTCMDELVNVDGAFCLAKEGELYVVYLPAGASDARLKLNLSAPMMVRWFNPRTGGDLSEGSVSSISGLGTHSLGAPPSDPGMDWVLVMEK